MTAESVLAAARDRHVVVMRAEIDKLRLAVEWVRLHPGEEVDTSIEWGMRDLEIAGDGAPTIDEGAIAEFALAIGQSTDAGRGYLGDAVELCHRLPRTWHRELAGEMPVWKARRIAQATRSLPMDGAGFVDTALYFTAHRCSFAEIDRQVEAARNRFDPAETERRRLEAAEQRHLDVHLDRVSADGLVYVDGALELADALALDQAIRAKAAALDPELSLDVRRSMAAGLLGGDDPGRDVTIYAHIRPGDPLVEVETTRSTITPEQLREWCQAAGTKILVRPVLDLNEELATDRYEPTDLMKEQARLRHPQCPFPRCTRPSRPGTDNDHIIEWPLGPTATSNLAPLCRTHHRLKTHTAWTYQWVPGTGFVWTDPHGAPTYQLTDTPPATVGGATAMSPPHRRYAGRGRPTQVCSDLVGRHRFLRRRQGGARTREGSMTHVRTKSAALLATTTCLVAGAALGVPAHAVKPRSNSSLGTSSVFMVNPVQSSGIQSLTDQKDAAGAVPASEYARVELRNLDGSGHLVGRWVNVRSTTGVPAYSPTNTFVFTRDDDRFEQVMAYFWVNQAQEYLRSLGFGSTLPPVNAESQDVRINQYGLDNSFSESKHDSIRLGKGGVDDAEDGEVIVHEYGHAVHDAQVPGFGEGSLDAGSIGEAFGDYLAVTVGLDAAHQYGWPVKAPEPCVADWDSTSYTSTTPHCLRRVDSDLVLADRRGEVHFDGMIWSAALWDIRQRYVGLGFTTRDWDRTLIDSQFDYAPDTSFSDAARATYLKALAMQGPEAAAAVRDAFADRQIVF